MKGGNVLANIDRIVNVQIALQTAGISEQGFNTALILTPEFTTAARVLTYNNVDQLLDDGATTTDQVYRAATDYFSQIPRPANIKIGQIVAGESVTDALAAINNADADWYGLAAVTRNQQDVIDIAEWTEAQIKLFGTSTDDPQGKAQSSTDDILAKMKDNNFFRSYGYYHKDAATDYPELAVMARCFSILPGGETWANKRLGGVITDKLRETEANAIFSKNGNTFEPFRNLAITQNGKVAAGEWIDVIRFRDWLQEDMQVRLFSLLINNNKIPYTDEGIRLIEAQMRASLELGQRRGGISPTQYDEYDNPIPGFTISMPLAANISFNDKANRVLNDAKFTAYLAGAIHKINVNGTLTYLAA